VLVSQSSMRLSQVRSQPLDGALSLDDQASGTICLGLHSVTILYLDAAGARGRLLQTPNNVCFTHVSFTVGLAVAVLPCSVCGCISFFKSRPCHLLVDFLPGSPCGRPRPGHVP